MTGDFDSTRLTLLLNELRLPTTKQIWPTYAERSDKEGWPAARLLMALAEHKLAERDRRRIERHLAQAKLLPNQTLDNFDFDTVPMVSKAQIGAQILIVGPSDTGKSHLAQALGQCAIRQDLGTVFSTCTQLTASLNAVRANGADERKLAALARVPLLIIDDFGLKPLRPPAAEDLHDLIAERYETAATIVTSNLDFPEWDQAFPANRLLAAATLDRLRHNAHCLTLDGQSFRAPKLAPLTRPGRLAKTAKSKQRSTTREMLAPAM